MHDPGQRYRGCLLGGAVGDALGAAVEFESLAAIRAKHGPTGIADFDVAYGRRGAITDDTQMTLFTAEGLLRAHDGRVDVTEPRLRALKDAYLRWLFTQGERLPGGATVTDGDGLLQHRELRARRGPGNTCLTALRTPPAEGLAARNDSKGCGGPMRVAPVALLVHALGGDADSACRLGTASGAITHGHPTGAIASGAFAVMILCALRGEGVEAGCRAARRAIESLPGNGETQQAIARALALAGNRVPPGEAIPQLGEGWIAEEAVAIAAFCALASGSFEEGVRMAVNIDGDSDSTGAMAGNLLGASLGEAAIPERWLAGLELRELIAATANRFAAL